MEEMDEIIGEFLVESYENLDRLDRELIALEQSPDDLATLSSIFRTIHTIKGSCAFLGFKILESVTHVGENLLSKLRDGVLPMTPERTTVLLKLVDAVRCLLNHIEQHRNEGDENYSELKAELSRLQESQTQQAPAPIAPTAPAPRAAAVATASSENVEAFYGDFSSHSNGHEAPKSAPSEAVAKLADVVPLSQKPSPKASSGGAEVTASVALAEAAEAAADGTRLGELLVKAGKCTSQDIVNASLIQAAGDKRRLGELLVEMGVIAPDDVVDTLRLQQTVQKAPTDRVGELLLAQGKCKPEDIQKARLRQTQGDPRRIGEILVAMGVVRSQDVADALSKQNDARPSVADNSIRVDVNLLEKLMNLVGELVLARNQILQFAERQEDSNFLAASQRLNLITTELQEGVMKTRMQPIGTLWSKFPRVVRDLALSCGKQVRIEMEGKDTELDRTIIEALKDPMTHIVRNSIDHGIERPEMRVARGKQAEGQLFLRAYHEGGQVIIEIVDDGGGIDPEKIRQKALSKGLITFDQSARMGEREIMQLIFLPGFSTAEQVTNISGRGVGMDVVKTNIEKIGGSLDLQSLIGQGTTLRIKIPLTLAIIPALIVTSLGDRYAIPQINLLELVRLDGEQARNGLEEVLGAPVYRLRGRLLPLLFLNRELKLKPGNTDELKRRDEINIVVLQADERQFGLVVDEINDTQEIVVKPLGKFFKGINTFAGATIMGDGRVALILDVLGLAQRARVVQENHSRSAAEAARQVDNREQRRSLLLFDVGTHGRMAIPLNVVARLEEFPTDSIEWAGANPVVQYRGEIMHLIELSSVLPERRKEARVDVVSQIDTGGKTQVVVYHWKGRSLGIVVGRILDVVDEVLTDQKPASRPGILSTAIIQNRVTQLVDVEGIIRSCESQFVASQAS